MNKFTTLLKREFWENQSTFLIVPVVVSCLLVVLMTLSLFVLNFEVMGDAEVVVYTNGERVASSTYSDGESDTSVPIRALFVDQMR